MKTLWILSVCLILFITAVICNTEVSARMEFTEMFERRQGALCRGFQDQKEMSLVFTGGHYGEGLAFILDELKKRDLKGAFFFTGDFFEIEAHQPLIRRVVQEGHYLGPHSDRHLLYAPWEDDTKTLVTREEFEADLLKNVQRCVDYGFPREKIVYWIPPYEHTSEEVAGWAADMGLPMFNFTKGTLSHTDYAPENDRAFRPTEKIIESIKQYPEKDPNGFNGFILLTHVGSSDRVDKMHPRFGEIVDFILAQGNTIVRLDELLNKGVQ